jgi:hypothetical protein
MDHGGKAGAQDQQDKERQEHEVKAGKGSEQAKREIEEPWEKRRYLRALAGASTPRPRMQRNRRAPLASGGQDSVALADR